MKAGKITKATFDSKDTAIGIVEITYEKSHFCLCKSKECNGPRIMISVRSKKTMLSIFPNGDHFGDFDHSVSGEEVTVVEVSLETMDNEDAFAERASKTMLTAYNKQ